MSRFEKVTELIDAITSYLSISHSHYAIGDLDFNRFGLYHTGQLGDVTVGSYLTRDDYGTPKFIKPRSTRYLHKLPEKLLEPYDNLELFLYLNRGLNYILTGNLPVQQHTETVSPFLYIDFLEFCLSVPLRYRIHHRLYRKWILEKYPGAAKYTWERLGSRITAPTIAIREKSMTYSKLPTFVYNGMRLRLGLVTKKKLEGSGGMNPFAYWYDTNPHVSNSIDDFFREQIAMVKDPDIRNDCETLFTTGNIHEKGQVITVLSAIKLYFT
jgi:asparagine synthase (glutamine-hydrolysing)